MLRRSESGSRPGPVSWYSARPEGVADEFRGTCAQCREGCRALRQARSWYRICEGLDSTESAHVSDHPEGSRRFGLFRDLENRFWDFQVPVHRKDFRDSDEYRSC